MHPDGLLGEEEAGLFLEETHKAFRRFEGRELLAHFVGLEERMGQAVLPGGRQGSRDDLAWWDLMDHKEPIMRISGRRAVFSTDGSTLATVTSEVNDCFY